MNRDTCCVAVCIAALVVAMSMPAVGNQSQEGYTFTLDGKPIHPYVMSLNGTPDDPQPGDVIRIDYTFLTLGAPGTYHFKTTAHEDGRLLLREGLDTERVVAATVSWSFGELGPTGRMTAGGLRREVSNPLLQLSDEEMKGLWGVRLDHWDEEVARSIERADLDRLCVTITMQAADFPPGKFPELPAELRYLCIEGEGGGFQDYSSLRALQNLAFFRLDSVGSVPFDVGLISSSGIRCLCLQDARLDNTEAMASLGALRHLDLSMCDSLYDISMVPKLDSLKRLTVAWTRVRDLSPLTRCDALTWVDAHSSWACKLPTGELPALRELDVMSTLLTADEVAAFSEANPRCRVLHRWDEALYGALEGTTRIRVRSGGTGIQNVDEQQTLLEEANAAKVREVIGNIRVMERPGAMCACHGNPTFEFYRGDELTASLSFHHGKNLRWPGGWPGDGGLTAGSADYLCRWLADHGLEGPQNERKQYGRKATQMWSGWRQYWDLLPPQVRELMQDDASRDEVLQALARSVPDPVARAQLCFRLLGIRRRGWEVGELAANLVVATLLRLDEADVNAAVEMVGDDLESLNGVAIWLFSVGRGELMGDATPKRVLLRVVREALAGPSPRNRRETIAALGRMGTDAAIQALRGVMDKPPEYPPKRQLRPEVIEAIEKALDRPAMVGSYAPLAGNIYIPWAPELPGGATEQACAALLLAKLGDRDSLPAIRALKSNLEKSSGRKSAPFGPAPQTVEWWDKRTLEQAVELLEALE
ncbi:MAG: HEAT repeat domain-containing protein [Candidatus Brocadiae bacterium]|nr:HEAT repeat domain-containing protein [Candidatus Brocadiia bacterium]